MEKPPLKPFRVQTKRHGRLFIHGDFNTIEMARAGARGTTAKILKRK